MLSVVLCSPNLPIAAIKSFHRRLSRVRSICEIYKAAIVARPCLSSLHIGDTPSHYIFGILRRRAQLLHLASLSRSSDRTIVVLGHLIRVIATTILTLHRRL